MGDRSRLGVLIAVSVALFTFGVLVASLGPILPDLQARTGEGLATLGTLFTALFTGSLVSQILVGVLNERLGWRRLMLLELGAFLLGLVGVIFSPTLPLLLGAATLMGLGQGAADVTFSVLAAEVYAERRVAALNLVNVFFGLGAILGPVLVGGLVQRWHTGIPVLVVGVVLAAGLVPWVWRSPQLARPMVAPTTSPAPPRAARSGPTMYQLPLLWVLGLFFLIYVGTETAIGGWTTEYLQRTTALSLSLAALATSSFWLALTVSRMAMTVLERYTPALSLLWMALLVATAGGVLLVLSGGHLALSISAIVLLGLSFGPLFPTALALTTAHFTTAPARAAGVVTALGSVGGMVIPWAQGILLTHQGPLSSAHFVAVLVIAMLALILGIQWGARRRSGISHGLQPL